MQAVLGLGKAEDTQRSTDGHEVQVGGQNYNEQICGGKIEEKVKQRSLCSVKRGRIGNRS